MKNIVGLFGFVLVTLTATWFGARCNTSHPYWVVYGADQLHRVTIEGRRDRVISPHVRYVEQQPVLSPDERWVAFVGDSHCMPVVYRLETSDWSQDALTSNPEVCPSDASQYGYYYLQWSPSSEWLLWVHPTYDGTSAPAQIYRMRFDGSGLVQLTDGTNDHVQPAWSPDGAWIVYVERDAWGQGYLMKMRADGSEREQLLNARGEYADPLWSPDGQWVYYRQRQGNAWNLYRLRGDRIEQLTAAPGYVGGAAWAPDGQSLLLVTDQDGDREIYRMAPDGSQVHQVTRNGGDDVRPVWSPDGEWIVFVSYRAQGRGLYRIRPDGRQEAPLTTAYARDWYATWAPFPRHNLHAVGLIVIGCTLLLANCVYNSSR